MQQRSLSRYMDHESKIKYVDLQSTAPNSASYEIGVTIKYMQLNYKLYLISTTQTICNFTQNWRTIMTIESLLYAINSMVIISFQNAL